MRKPEMQVGSIVKCIEDVSVSDGGPQEGEYYIVTCRESDWIGFELPRYNSSFSKSNLIREGMYANWGVTCFELIGTSKVAKILFTE